MPQASFRERSIRLKHLEDEKNNLIDDLIRQLESSQQHLQQLRLEYDNEAKLWTETKENEETLQQEMNGMRTLLDRNSYVTVLIDGDSLTFSKELVSRGESGGMNAAQLLANTIKSFAVDGLPHLRSVNVHVKLFMNVKALVDALTRQKVIHTPAAHENFLQGLLSSEMIFDVIDTSCMKGRTIRKIQESYRHDYINVHCHQIFLAALANHELNGLLDETPDVAVHERVTLLEARGLQPNDRFDHEIQSIKVDGFLTKVEADTFAVKTPAAKVATPVLARIESNTSSRTPNSGQASAASTPVLTWAAMTAQPFVPKPGDVRSETSTPISATTPPPSRTATSAVPRNRLGQRVDNVDDAIPYQELQRIKKMKLCNIYYLQGKDACTGDCGHSHTYPLKTAERNILKEVARMTPCYYKTECDDPACIYGHRCPQSKPDKKDCYYKSDCRFVGWGHGIDTKVVKIQNVK
ncbi:hypothetical protein LTR70_008939 [Exophiala xenobiotica]|uniref:C3H1-type domain-containing protein n=1 Tax=Lithohypha guttulata TaxID=1690604 RepID=A0ABR0JZG9_9EURO|nr:hypothetical protein LTR24_008643 [Lithohypha guttulata]KAK5311223.1 hypothetical protein LTR70_008939 [Exophiala xenobiotica]